MQFYAFSEQVMQVDEHGWHSLGMNAEMNWPLGQVVAQVLKPICL